MKPQKVPKVQLGAPQDPTRVMQDESWPQDESIYANPVTTNQESISRTPSTKQVGALPNNTFNNV